MSKIPQRVKEPSSYAKIFAKHKASQYKRDENVDEPQTSENSTHDGLFGSHGDVQGSHGIPPRGQPGSSGIPLYGTNHIRG